MKNLNNESKAKLVQCCINCYEDENGKGVHGEVDWSFFKPKSAKPFVEDCQEGYRGVARINGDECGVIAFEGSSNKDGGKDWKRNFDTKKINDIKDEANAGAVKQIPYGNTDTKIRMHRGVYQAYQPVRELVRDFAQWCRKLHMPIYVTGHSLGGGVTHVAYIDLHYMFHTEQGIPQADMDFLTGYAAASLAVYNWAGAVSHNKRADGNFYTEWYGNDTVHDVPPFTGLGYVHTNIQKRYSSVRDNLLFVPTHLLQWATLGFLPSVGAYDHDPRKLLAAIQGKPIPVCKLDSRK